MPTGAFLSFCIFALPQNGIIEAESEAQNDGRESETQDGAGEGASGGPSQVQEQSGRARLYQALSENVPELVRRADIRRNGGLVRLNQQAAEAIRSTGKNYVALNRTTGQQFYEWIGEAKANNPHGDLSYMYSKHGFIPVARTHFVIARGDVLLRIEKKDDSAKVVIGFTSGGKMVLYDVIGFVPTKIKVEAVELPSNHVSVKNSSGSTASTTTSISNTTENVNRKDSVSEEIAEEQITLKDIGVLRTISLFPCLVRGLESA